RLKDDPHRSRDKKTGRRRSEEDMVFRVTALVSESKAKKLGIPITIEILRLLFNAPPDAELHEHRGGPYRNIVPASYVLTKRRAKNPPPSQDELLSIVRKLVTDAPTGSLPVTADQMVALLSDLFAINDTWHWDELFGRIPEDVSRYRQMIRNLAAE